MPSTPYFSFFPGGLAWGLDLESNSSTISSKSIAVESRISRRISSVFTSITLRIWGRNSGNAKKELGFWSSKDLVTPIRLKLNYGNSGQTPINGNFGTLSKELYDLGNILE